GGRAGLGELVRRWVEPHAAAKTPQTSRKNSSRLLVRDDECMISSCRRAGDQRLGRAHSHGQIWPLREPASRPSIASPSCPREVTSSLTKTFFRCHSTVLR